ncbi:ATP-grasp domain-containing protein [Vibrio alginolyticus]
MLDYKAKTARNRENRVPSVLVLGEDTRSFLSVIRSLGRAGYEVHVVCYDRTSPALKSKYISSAFFYNYQAHKQDEWLDNVVCLIERYKYDVIFPCDERSIYPLWQIRNHLPSETKLAISNQQALDVLFDKWKTKQVALQHDIPVARGELVDLRQRSYDQLREKYGDKFVVKPLQSFEMQSLERREKVLIVKSLQDYIDFTESNSVDRSYLVEAYFQGNGEGLSVFSVDGNVKAAFSYRRLAEPDTGGGSSYRGSSEIDPEQLSAVELVCSETNLTGLAMFEFRRNTDNNEWILVEVNARVWGGLPLAEVAGIDFPKMYCDYLCKGTVTNGIATTDNHVNARALTADLYEIKREGEKILSEKGRGKSVLHMTNRIASIAKVVTKRESIDSLRLDDPKPFVAEMSEITNNISVRIVASIPFLTLCRRKLIRHQLQNILLENPTRRILFICYGNIIRSPFAEKYFMAKMARSNVWADIDSFGFHLKEMRKSPQIAISAAAQLQCDLSEHTSKCITQLDIRETDVLIYFDEKNKNMIESGYKVNHVYCAADFLDSSYPSLRQIDDPYESDVETIKVCYEKIQNALDNFVRIYKGAIQ